MHFANPYSGYILLYQWERDRRSQSGTIPTDYLYTGQRQEAELGLYYYVARWYDPAIGRFLQTDTIVPNPASAKAFDRYAYTYNNPVKYIDPSGHVALGANDDDICPPGSDCFEELVPLPVNGDNDEPSSRGGGTGIFTPDDCSRANYTACFLSGIEIDWQAGEIIDIEQFNALLLAVFLRVWYMDHDGLGIPAVYADSNLLVQLWASPDWVDQGDTPFYDGGIDNGISVQFEEGFMEGEWLIRDVNYLMIGMLGKAAEMTVEEVFALSNEWKQGMYQHTLEEPTKRWIEFGYTYYSTYESVVGPHLPKSNNISFGEWYESVNP